MTAESLLEHHRVAGASTDARDGVALATTYPEALSVPLEANAVAVVDLSHRPVFRLVGSDVRRWTNGMFTNNTRRLRPGQGNRHCACDDRGRVRGGWAGSTVESVRGKKSLAVSLTVRNGRAETIPS